MTNVTRIFDILPYQKLKCYNNVALAGKENDQWITYSTDDFLNTANLVSYALMAMGISKDDKIATISNNRPQWNMFDFGILQVGAVQVAIYPTISENDYKFILTDADVKLIMVSDADLANKMKNIISQLKPGIEIFTFDKVPGFKHWSDLLDLGKSNVQTDKLQQLKNAVNEKDLATLIYTSGTTGNPKGVMLSHFNLVSNFKTCKELAPINKNQKVLSFLPLCHVYERMLTYLYMYIGVSIYYAESIEKIGDNIREVKPHAFSAVPRLLEKVFNKIVAKGRELTGIKRALFFWALNLGYRYRLNGENGWWYDTQLKLANKLIFNKWREALGGNTQIIVSGGAALQPRLARVFWAAQILVVEGYGLTETSPVIALNCIDKDRTRFGTVGPVIPGVEVKFEDDGEILVKGPSVMSGYYKNKEQTDEAFTADGWFRTGDIGVMEEGRFLKITDRKKELLKTSGGKTLAPQPMENRFKESMFIENIMIIGEGHNFPAALIYPAVDHILQWCKIKTIPVKTKAEVYTNEQVRQRITQEIEDINKEYGKTEKVKNFELVPEEWTVASGELTPTLKLKRKIILANNQHLVRKIYANEVVD
ncbi:MAG: long-chain fatty acid--CoA ligase [Bacteroidia bacterium]|nr:long-chain fatty acid--CoA ligase [Bacteroidia bacterium]